MKLEAKQKRLRERLADYAKVAVAFSGGVDSTLLLATAREVLGSSRVLALTVAAPLFPAAELKESRVLAARLGVRQSIVDCDPLAHDEIAANPPLRCYHCKRLLFGLLQEKARQAGFPVLLDGSNLDDLQDYRPGRQALAELGIHSPLLEAELTKADVRALSRQAGLPTADKPALACLASRFPYQRRITAEGLAQVERCEKLLHRLGFRQCRVRHHGETARIEVGLDEMPGILKDEVRSALVAECRAAGFTYTALDLSGYRTGSLNDVLKSDGS